MKINRGPLMVLTAALFGLGAYRLQAQSQEPGLRPDGENPFAGKVVEVWFKSDRDHTAIVKDAAVRTLGGARFLVGTAVEVKGYLEGLEAWVALDDTAQIGVFESIEDRTGRYERWQAAQKVD